MEKKSKQKQYIITIDEGKEEIVKNVLERINYVTVEEVK